MLEVLYLFERQIELDVAHTYDRPNAKTEFLSSAAVVVCIQTVVFLRILHIHKEMASTSHFLMFSRPKPGGICIYMVSQSGFRV